MKLPPRIQLLVNRTAERYGISPRDMCGKSKERSFLQARADFAAQLRTAGVSNAQIGKYLGGRDPSTISVMMSRYPFLFKYNAKKFEYPTPDLSGEWAI